MRHFLITVAVAATIGTISAPAAANEIMLNIGQPSFHGQLNICGYPQPQAIYRQPRSIVVIPTDRPLGYLRASARHSKHWSRHCCNSKACAERVFPVRTIVASTPTFHITRNDMVIAGMTTAGRTQG